MDLYEIRKKAKEKKEAEDRAEEQVGKPGAAAEGSAAEEPVRETPGKKPRKKAAGKKAAKTRKAAPKKASGKTEAAPERPAPDVAPPEVPAQEAEPAVPEPGWSEAAGMEPSGTSEAVDEFAGDGEIFLDGPDIPLDELMQQAFEAEKADEAAEEAPAAAEVPAPREAEVSASEKEAAAPSAEKDEAQAAGTVPADAGDGGEEAEAENVIEYLAFMLSEEEYAVKVSDIKEIIRPQKITMVPRAPDFVEGIFSLRGVIIPVFDIKKRLGFQNTDRERGARILIVSDGGTAQGMIVDRVTGVARLKADSIEPPPAVIGGVEAEYLEGIGRLDGRLLILFNTSRVLSMEG